MVIVKYKLLLLALVGATTTFSFNSSATEKGVDIDAAIGYRFGGQADAEAEGAEGRLTIGDAPAFTVIGSYQIQSNGKVYLNYSRQASTLQYVSDDLQTKSETPFNTDSIQFGGNLTTKSGALSPYIGFSLGATHYGAPDENLGAWSFSMALDGGVEVTVTKWLHLLGVARMPLTFAKTNSEVFCVSPVGCVALVSGGPIVQGEIFGGFGIHF